MQRNDVMQVLNDPLAQDLMQSNIPVRMAYTGVDGFPRVVPLGFHWNGERFVICTIPSSPKVRALMMNPRIAMTIDTNTFPPHVLLVRGAASIETVDGVPPEYLEASRKQVADGTHNHRAHVGEVVGLRDPAAEPRRAIAEAPGTGIRLTTESHKAHVRAAMEHGPR